MEWIRISEVCRPKQWKTISMKNLKEEGYPVYGANGIIGYYDEYTHEEDTLMITCRGATCGSINMSNEKAYINGNAMALDDLNNEIIDIKYFYYYLLGYDFADIISGSAQPQITRTNLNRLKIPVPPINIQKQIVEVLDKAQSLIDNRKEQIKLLDDLIESVFYDMFGDPVRNDKGWEVKKLKEESVCIVPVRDKPKSFTGNIPWITINDLEQNGYTITSKEKLGLTENEILEVNRKVVPIGCVLMSCVGNLGITSINGVELIINQQIHAFKCSENLNNKYLKHYIPKRMDYLDRVANSTTVKYINKTKCENIPLLFPPIELQNQFAEKVEQIESQKQLLEDSLKLLEDNYNSLMQKAFKGELFN